MPILTQNIKLLKSTVMADTSDGGGQMTGVAIVDGASNNLFPDTSAMDRAFGRVNMRKVFGVAHTTDRDTLMGAHAIITDSPDDPLVHCALMKTSGWADDRTNARSVIESYLAKGNKYGTRIYDTHYAGALQLRVYSFQNAQAPTGGDAVVIRNPNGNEQYVRVLKSVTTVQNIAVVENGTTLVLAAQITVCDLGQALLWDVMGPPAVRVGLNEASYASLYTTVVASGSKFYGVKPLASAAAPGDLYVTAAGGMYTPLVPAATIETPIIDRHPLITRSALVNTSRAPVVVTPFMSNVGPGTVFTMPGPIAPKTLSVSVGSTAFNDSVSGDGLCQGTTLVGSVDYAYGIITFLGTSPAYGTAYCQFSYSPATLAGATAYSVANRVTISNQGLAYTNQFNPPPGPGSFQLSYMAQGRWYTLDDNKVGKLSGSDSSYGVGNISYLTGSMAVTLGAIPDIGSDLIAHWGDAASATAITALPARASTSITGLNRPMPNGVTISWSHGGNTYTSTSDANGVLSGDATGQVSEWGLEFAPAVFPTGDVTVDYLLGPTTASAFTGDGLPNLQLTATGICKNSVKGHVTVTPTGATVLGPQVMDFWDVNGVIYVADDSVLTKRVAIGPINYATGLITFSSGLTRTMYVETPYTGTGWVETAQLYSNEPGSVSVTLSNAAVTSYGYGTPPNTPSQVVATPTFWTMKIPVLDMGTLNIDGLCFTMGGELFTSKAGALRKGWNASTGIPVTAAAGTVSSEGLVSIPHASVPANMLNNPEWLNAAMDSSSKRVTSGVFRAESAPLKTGVLQLSCGARNGNADDNGDITGTISGTADFIRGVVKWQNTSGGDPAAFAYNAVFLQYLPLDASLLGMDTARLPLDGKVPIYRSGDLVVVHNTLEYTITSVIKDQVYDLGRLRLASVRVKDAANTAVPDTLYTVDLNLGTLVIPTASNITAYTQPFKVEHRIEDMVLCSQADISGKLTFTRSLTHDFPATTSFVSSAMPFGDLFARVYAAFEQATWTSTWQDSIIGSPIIPQFNVAQYPIVATNQGAIKERWLILFTNSTSFRVIGESVGEIGVNGSGALGSTASPCAPVNPATNAPYFTIPAGGWGAGWAVGNCLRFNTDACGTPIWVVRTVLQGPPSIESDQFTLAFRGDVDRP